MPDHVRPINTIKTIRPKIRTFSPALTPLNLEFLYGLFIQSNKSSLKTTWKTPIRITTLSHQRYHSYFIILKERILTRKINFEAGKWASPLARKKYTKKIDEQPFFSGRFGLNI
jgi:hypothetical protein